MVKTTFGSMEEYVHNRAARLQGREPTRVEEVGDMVRTLPVESGYRPLDLSGVILPVGHPLEDTPSERRALRRRVQTGHRS